MSARLLIGAGLALFALAWVGPLPRLVPQSFAAHMILHMLVVAIAAPVLAAGLVRVLDGLRVPNAAAIIVSLLDFAVIWLWHSPMLHHASITSPGILILEQASFAGVALLVWVAALGGQPLAGALTLFFTSMHMTLLGALIGLAPRAIYDGHAHHGSGALDPLQQQHIGGVVMLAVGGVVYLAGGLMLARKVLRVAP